MAESDPRAHVPSTVFEDPRPQFSPEPERQFEAGSVRAICELAELRLKMLGRLKYETTVCLVRDASLGLAEVRLWDDPEDGTPSRVYANAVTTPRPLPELHLNGVDYAFVRSTGCGLTDEGVTQVGIANIIVESGRTRPFEYTVGETNLDSPEYMDLDTITQANLRRLASALLRITPEDIIADE